MPLIIAILALIVGVLVANDSIKDSRRVDNNLQHELRKTNAKLERETVDKYLKQGFTFNESYDLAAREVVHLGFEPCIPKTAYINTASPNTYSGEIYESSVCKESIEKFDAPHVRARRDALIRACQPVDSYLYKDFPTNRRQYENDCGNLSRSYKLYREGQTVMHPKFGMCQILSVNATPPSFSYGTYVAKCIRTGETITFSTLDNNVRIVR